MALDYYGNYFDLSAQSFITYSKIGIQEIFTLNQDIDMTTLPIKNNDGSDYNTSTQGAVFRIGRSQVFDANNKKITLPYNINRKLITIAE
jgi:hypothetical protein